MASTDTEQIAAQRIDKWLWHARLFKTRSLASRQISDGGARLTRNGETKRITKASTNVQAGDTIAFSKGVRLMIVEVTGLATRRGPAAEAQALYTDHSPPPPPREAPAPTPFAREKGTGRPTKRDRRKLTQIQDS